MNKITTLNHVIFGELLLVDEQWNFGWLSKKPKFVKLERWKKMSYTLGQEIKIRQLIQEIKLSTLF